jgi:hypothetical protein
MKRLLIVILTAATLWSAYWIYGARQVGAGYEAWLQARTSEGWVAQTDEMKVRGYPNRLDTTFTMLELADPDSGLAWTMPFFQLLSLSYQPNHVIAVWPHDQRISTPDHKYDLQSDRMRASMVFDETGSLSLNRSNLELLGGELRSGTATLAQVSTLNVAVIRQSTADPLYRLSAKAEGLSVQDLQGSSTPSPLPETFDTAEADLLIGFDKPWDGLALSDTRPQPTSLDIRHAELLWGDLRLRAAGTLTIDATGTPTGDMSFRVENWKDILALAERSGQVSPAILSTLKQGLTMLSGLSGNANTLDIPLKLRGGLIYLGPIPIGKSPKLVIR